MSDEHKVEKAAWKRSRAADYAVRLLTLEFVKQFYSLFENHMLYAVENDSRFEYSAAQQFCFRSLELPLMFATPWEEIARPVQIKRPARVPAELVELDDEE